MFVGGYHLGDTFGETWEIFDTGSHVVQSGLDSHIPYPASAKLQGMPHPVQNLFFLILKLICILTQKQFHPRKYQFFNDEKATLIVVMAFYKAHQILHEADIHENKKRKPKRDPIEMTVNI